MIYTYINIKLIKKDIWHSKYQTLMFIKDGKKLSLIVKKMGHPQSEIH